MRNRRGVFAAAVLAGGVLGSVWNWPGFSGAYKGFIALFADTSVPIGSAGAAIVLAFVMGVPRICVP